MGQRDRLLIINADDLGLAAGVSRGIIELAERGGITSASLLPNMPGSATALQQARTLGLDLGVHLNLCAGAPLTPAHRVRSLLGGGECFAGVLAITRRGLTGALRLEEVEREWSAQIEWVLDHDVHPSHLDSHVHTHALPRLYPLILRLARRYRIRGVRPAIAGYIYQSRRLTQLHFQFAPIRRRAGRQASGPQERVQRPVQFSVLTALGRLRDNRPLHALLRALPAGVTELVAHPGHIDDELRRLDPLTEPREREWQMLASPTLRALLVREGIRLISWAELPDS